jgi:hypothetical protein
MNNKIEQLDKLLGELQNEARRDACFIAILSEEVVVRGGKCPIVVGETALELYTQGRVLSGSIDLIMSRELLTAILSEWGFQNTGRKLWVSEKYNLFVDWQGETLGEGGDREKKAVPVQILNKYTCKLAPLEDVLVDRLCAAKFWNDQDSFGQAEILIEASRMFNIPCDQKYLKEFAQKQNVSDLLERLLLQKNDEPGI